MMSAEQKAAWLAERCGCLTASNMKKAMAFLRNGEPAKERTDHQYEIIAERLTGFSVPHVVTEPMLHGQEYEDEAADKFVELTGRDLQLSRFYLHPEIEYFGATPDRELDDGLLEIKCPTSATHLRTLLERDVPEDHLPQIHWALACSGRAWWDFVSYDPRFPDPLQFFQKRVMRDETIIGGMEADALDFLSELGGKLLELDALYP